MIPAAVKPKEIPADRLSIAAALLALAGLAGLAVFGRVLPAPVAALFVVVCLGVALTRRLHPAARSIALLVAALGGPMPLLFSGLPWQLVMAVALGLWALVARRWPALGGSEVWRARGSVPILATVVVGGVTPIALVGWLAVMRPDLRDVVGNYVPDLPLPILVIGAVGFALINAAGEELVWRGVLQDRLTALVGAREAVALQALSFGVQHAHGVPRGAIGVLLAGIWAVMLGMLRQHTRGLLAPLVAHVVADAVIAVIILTLATS